MCTLVQYHLHAIIQVTLDELNCVSEGSRSHAALCAHVVEQLIEANLNASREHLLRGKLPLRTYLANVRFQQPLALLINLFHRDCVVAFVIFGQTRTRHCEANALHGRGTQEALHRSKRLLRKLLVDDKSQVLSRHLNFVHKIAHVTWAAASVRPLLHGVLEALPCRLVVHAIRLTHNLDSALRVLCLHNQRQNREGCEILFLSGWKQLEKLDDRIGSCVKIVLCTRQHSVEVAQAVPPHRARARPQTRQPDGRSLSWGSRFVEEDQQGEAAVLVLQFLRNLDGDHRSKRIRHEIEISAGLDFHHLLRCAICELCNRDVHSRPSRESRVRETNQRHV
mmetsp:Transcript_37777/g.99159  ORF Transcript_37777/g.99159 Transcript_37777/m.99159 type:complete len:337 (+) Transcript_37777:1488-2498(+)